MPAKVERNGPSVRFHGRSISSVPTTFRVDADVFEAVSSLAEKEKTSVNAVANRALRRYIEWEVFAEKFGLLSITSGTITKLFDTLTDFDYVSDGDVYTLFIRHEKGRKHSLYYEEAAKALFGRLGIKPEISLTDSQVTLTISKEEVHKAERHNHG